MEETPEKLERIVVPSLDSILGKAFGILDDGFVRVVDYMGSDESINNLHVYLMEKELRRFTKIEV